MLHKISPTMIYYIFYDYYQENKNKISIEMILNYKANKAN